MATRQGSACSRKRRIQAAKRWRWGIPTKSAGQATIEPGGSLSDALGCQSIESTSKVAAGEESDEQEGQAGKI
jgi:hypothetical protein